MIKNQYISPNQQVKITTIDIPNMVFRSMRERTSNPEIVSIEAVDLPWFVNTPTLSNKMSKDLFDKLSNHKLVKARKFESWPDVTSFAFTRDAFYDKKWDEINKVARGLFVNHETFEICVRSYEKFFNIRENEQHGLRSLENKLKFPITIYEKENGFLGLVGYDSQSDKLFITSKGSVEGDFADNFRRIFNLTFTQEQQVLLKGIVRDQEATLVFEVIDPIADPHLVEYPNEKIVLLDIVARSEEFMKAPFKAITALANKFQIEHKKKHNVFKDFQHFQAWLTNVEARDASVSTIEGYVVEDADGFCFKIKDPAYQNWKYMRSFKDRKAASLEKGHKYDKRIDTLTPIQLAFVSWIDDKNIDFLKRDIITLRKEFLKQHNGA